MKAITLITNYFPPETGAASNRIAQLALGLQKRGYSVGVICPLPNYPKGRIFEGYRGKLMHTEHYEGIHVTRLYIFPSNSNQKFKRLFAMLSFSFSLGVYRLLHSGKFAQKIIVQSPPLILSASALFFFNRNKRKLILNVSDLWPSAGLELGALQKGRMYTLLERLERYIYKKAHLVLGQSKEIIARVLEVNPKQQTFLYRNLPQASRLNFDSDESDVEQPIKLVYAGLLGIAQGIVKLCKNIELGNHELHIYGAGAEQQALQDYLKNSEKPIFYHGEVSRKHLLKQLGNYDLAIVPLTRAIYGSTPSKIYEMALGGLPMLYFAGGEGEQVVQDYQLGYVVEPGDFKALNRLLVDLKKNELKQMSEKIRESAAQHFNLELQLDALVQLL